MALVVVAILKDMIVYFVPAVLCFSVSMYLAFLVDRSKTDDIDE